MTTSTVTNESPTINGPTTLVGTTIVDEVKFNTGITPSNVLGTTYWDDAEHTIATILDPSNGVVLQHGTELYVRCVNKTGSTILNGNAVYVSGAQGNRPKCILARADAITTTAVIGVTTQDIANNAEGFITLIGDVHGVNTTGFLEGDTLYLSSTVAGQLTNIAPSSPNYVAPIAEALNSTVNGTISVHTHWPLAADKGFSANSDIVAPTQAAVVSYVGHAVTKDFTGFSSPESIIVNYDSTARTITLTGTVAAYWQGVKISVLVSGWVSTAHPNTNGPWFLYYDGTNFVWSATVWTFDTLQIAFVNYGVSDKFALRECHGTMPWTAHEEFHRTVGTYLQSGGDLGSYVLASTTAANRMPSVTAPIIHDEDLTTTNPLLAAGGPYTQNYLTGTGTSAFTTGAAEIVPVTGAHPNWNQFSTPNWVQTPMSNNSYMSIWLIAVPASADTGSQAYRYLWLQGQTNGTLAQEQATTLGGLNLGQFQSLFTEFVPLAKVIIQYTAGNWTLASVEKITGTRVSSVVAPGSGTFLSSVSVTAPITGDGTATTPLAISAATTLAAGSMSAADKTKLDGVATGATANLGTVTSVAALTLGTTGTDLSSSVATGTTTPVITLNVPTASATNRGALSAADWTTFNGKQAALGFTPINKAGDTGIGDLYMGALTATYQNTQNSVGTDGQSVWDINASGMGVNTRIKFANAQLGGQTLGLGYLQWLRDLSQGRTFSVFTCDILGVSVEAFKLDGPNGGAATFASSVSMGALTATTVDSTSGVITSQGLSGKFMISTRGDIGMWGDGAYGMYVGSPEGFTVNLDNNNNGSATGFQVRTGGFGHAGGTQLFNIATSGAATFASSVSMGALTATTATTSVYAVASLPTGSIGMRAMVNNALAPTFGASVVGGGTVVVPVYHDGVSWKVG